MFIELSLVLSLSILGATGSGPYRDNVDVCVSMDYDDVTTEIFDGQTEETIGWIKILSCKEGYNAPYYLNPHIDELLPLAYTFRLAPPNAKSNSQYNNLAAILKPGSTLMNELNNGERPESSSNTDWIGSSQALTRVTMPHPRNPYSKFGDQRYFWANGNGLGVHVTDGHCYWDWHDNLGQDLEMYLGYLTYDDVTTETFGGAVSESIGWVKILSCKEGYNAPYYLNPNIDSLLATAYTFRMTPPNGKSNSQYDDLAVILKPGSTLMNELKTGERPESTSTGDWIGSTQALQRAQVPNPRNPYSKFGDYRYFWANGNGIGIHVTDGHCYWDWHDNLGQDLEMYIGYQNTESAFNVPSVGLNDWRQNMFHIEQYPYINYLAFALIILLLLNIVCITMNIRKKRSSKQYKYNKVVNESECSE